MSWIARKIGIDLNEDYDVNVAHENLKSIYQTYWRNKLFDDKRAGNHYQGNKLRSYRQFKLIYETEPYLLKVNNFLYRQALAKFRISNNRSKIETGRFENLPVNERVCNVCNIEED